MCKLNSLAVITAQTVEIKPFALQSSSKWISGLIAKRVHCKNTVGHQFTKDISDAPVLEYGHYCASPSQPQTYTEVSHFKSTWILFYNQILEKSRVSYLIALCQSSERMHLGPLILGP